MRGESRDPAEPTLCTKGVVSREEAGPENGVWAWANSAVKRGKRESKSWAGEDEGPATEREVKARSLQERLG